MNNNEETTSNKDQEQKIDNVENNAAEPNLENNLEKKIEELNDKLLRSLAENQNLRKIHEKEREDLIKYSSSSFAREILNLADNLERAFGLFKDNPKFKTDEFKDTMLGIGLIEKELITDKNKIEEYFNILEAIDLSKENIDLINFKKALYLINNDKLKKGNELLKKLLANNSNFKELIAEILEN